MKTTTENVPGVPNESDDWEAERKYQKATNPQWDFVKPVLDENVSKQREAAARKEEKKTEAPGEQTKPKEAVK